MSELDFGILDNNADFIKKATQMRGAIHELGMEFATVSTQTNTCTEKTKEFIDALRIQIDSTIVALEKIKSENLSQVWSLQTNVSKLSTENNTVDEQFTPQTENILSEISARKDLTEEVQHQLSEMNKLITELLEYEQKLKQTQDTQTTFHSGLKGVEEGLGGVSGAMSVITGTMELFGVENETLQRAMQKVQTAIEITNGLQAVSTALNKDSAFQLNLLGKVKLWWKNITLQAATAQGVETIAASTGTVINLGLAGSFRAIGLAIKSIPIFGWIAAGISTLIGVYSLWSSSTNQQTEKQSATK